MAGYDELKIEVGFILDESAGSDLERQLAYLSNSKDFKIKANVDINDHQIESLGKLEKVLSKLGKITDSDVGNIKGIGKAFSSFKIDNSIVANIEKVEKSLSSFSKLSTEMQRKLADVSFLDGAEKDVKGITMKMEEFDKQVQKTLKDIQKGVKGSTESLTGYVNAQSGTTKTLVEQLNEAYKVTKKIDADGNVVGKVTGNIDGYVNKIGSTMKQNYGKLLQYQGEYYKAVANQDTDMINALEGVMDFYKHQQKLLKQSLSDNGLKDYSRDRINEIEEIYNLNSRLSDIKGINLLDKEQIKGDEKALSSFIKEYKNVIDDLKKYEPQLLQSKYDGKKMDNRFLTEKVEALKKQKEAMEEAIPTFKQWEKALQESEKNDSQLQDKIAQKIAQLNDKELKRRREKQEQEEKDKYSNTLSEYEKITNEIKRLNKDQKDSAYNGNDATFSKVTKEIDELEKKRTALRETAEELRDYEKAQKKINEIDSKFDRDNGIKDSKIQDKLEKEKYANLLSNYKDVSDQLQKLAKKQRTDLDSGNKSAVSESTEQIKALAKRKKAMEEEMKTLKEYGKISNEVANINKKNRNELNVIDAGRQDSSLNKANDEVKKLEQAYQKLGKTIHDSLSKTSAMKDNSLLQDTNIKEVYNDLLKMSRIDFKNLGSADVDNLTNKLERLQKTIRDLENIKIGNKQSTLNNLKVDKLESEFASLERQIRKTLGDSHADALVNDLKQVRQAVSKSGDEFDIMQKKYTNSIDKAKRSMQSFGQDLKSSGGFFNDFYENLFTFTAGELLAEGIQNVGYALADVVMEYDHAMTNLKKVANPEDIMNSFQLDAIEQKAVGIAKNVGAASQDVIQAIADTIQMSGKSMEESVTIAEQTMMLANVAEMTQEAASEAVVSMMAAFNLDPLKEVPVLVNGVTKSTTELTNAMDMVNHVG